MNPILRKKRMLIPLCLILCFCLLLTGCKDRPTRTADKLFESLDVMAPNGEAVRQARAAYDSLDEKQRQNLEHLDQFLEAEKEYHAQEVDALIDAIGTVTPESGNAIEAARKAYEALDQEVAARVKKLSALQDAEIEYPAQKVDAMIDAIGTVTLDSGDAIKAAKAAYEALDQEVAARVRKLNTLEEAEKELHRVTVEHAANEIDSLIEAIGTVTLESGDAIEAAKTAYASADQEVAGLVSKLPELEKAVGEFHHLEVLRDAEAMDKEILSLGTITLESGPDIEKVRAHYDALDGEIKGEVRELKTLTAAEEQFVYLGNLAKAETVDQAISALGEITPEKEADVETARKQYEKLPADAQKLVTQLSVLEDAEAALMGYKDEAASAEIKKLLDAKQYAEAIEYAEKQIAGRDPEKVQGKVVEYCVKAYVEEANAQMKDKHYEAADNLLSTCADRYPSANQNDVKAAQKKLDKAIAEPKNGQVFDTKARGGYCELTIKSGNTPVYIKVVSKKDESVIATFYVRKDSSSKIKIKDGNYSLRYATGDKWYGEKDLFGSGTRYYSADTTLEMKTTRSGNRISYQTYTITLYTVAGGNMSTTKIPQDKF